MYAQRNNKAGSVQLSQEP